MNWKIIIASLLIALPALADDFRAANQLYDSGKFAEAAAAYEKVEPKTAHVYFNFGNALFRQEKFGLAVLNYERARQLAPRDPDIVANLRFARQRLAVDELNIPPHRRFVQAIIRSRTTNEWSRYEVVALWITILAVAGAVWLPRVRTGMILIASLAALGTLLTSGAIISQRRAPPAAIVVSRVDARFAPSAGATVHFRLPEGAKVAVREDRGAWIFAERADGKQGWVKSESVERVVH